MSVFKERREAWRAIEEAQCKGKGRERIANDAMRVRLNISRYLCKSSVSCLIMVVVAGFSIELVVHVACCACIRVKRIVHFAARRSLSAASHDEGMGAQGWGPRRGPSAAAMPEEEIGKSGGKFMVCCILLFFIGMS